MSSKFSDLKAHLDKGNCYCLNEDPNATFENVFMGDHTLLLKSDADGNVFVVMKKTRF